MKRLQHVLLLTLCLAIGSMCLTGCGGKKAAGNDATGVITVANSPDEVAAGDESKTPLAQVSDFTFDFETLTYTFTGVENAEFYYIRTYPVVDGQEGNSATFQSEKLEAEDGNTYSGTITGETLLAGDYAAHLVASGTGFASSDVQTAGTSTLLATATLSATWNTGDEGDATVSADIVITAGDNLAKSFTLVVTNEGGSEVYKNAAAVAGTVNLTAADLGAETLTVDDIYNVTVTVNQVPGYRLPAEGTTTQIAQARRFGGPGGPGGPG